MSTVDDDGMMSQPASVAASLLLQSTNSAADAEDPMRLRSRGRGPSEHARLPSKPFEAVLGPRCLSGSLALLSFLLVLIWREIKIPLAGRWLVAGVGR
jgi:hypothetical protein